MSLMESHLLAEIVGRKHDCLLQLRELGRQQYELIGAGQMTQLLKLLSVKQQLIHQLQSLEQELDPFRGQDPAARQWSTPEARGACARLIESSQELFNEIMGCERESEQLLSRRRDETAERLRSAHYASAARQAYTGSSDEPGGYVDLSSQS